MTLIQKSAIDRNLGVIEGAVFGIENEAISRVILDAVNAIDEVLSEEGVVYG